MLALLEVSVAREPLLEPDVAPLVVAEPLRLPELPEVGTAGEKPGVVLAEGVEERARPTTLRVGVEAAEQGRHDRRGRLPHVVRGGPHATGDVVDAAWKSGL